MTAWEPLAKSVLDAEEATLWAEARQGSEAARQAIFKLHSRFARNLAERRLRARGWRGIDVDDVRQLAYMGLLEAIDRYDPTLGTPFRAFASRRVLGSVIDGLKSMSEVSEQIAMKSRLRADRTRSLLAQPQKAADARGADASALDALVELALGLAVGFILDDATSSSEAAAGIPNGYESLAWKDTVRRLSLEVDGLGERDRFIIQCHYRDGADFEVIGKLLGVSKGRVSQLHRAAITTLRKRLPKPGTFSLRR